MKTKIRDLLKQIERNEDLLSIQSQNQETIEHLEKNISMKDTNIQMLHAELNDKDKEIKYLNN